MTHVILFGKPDINYRRLNIELRFGQKAFGGDELPLQEKLWQFSGQLSASPHQTGP